MSNLPTGQSLRALDGVNFFIAAVLAGFGPFVALFLGDRGWSQQDIGFVLSAAGITGLLSQIPGGELLDATRSKRLLVGAGTLMLAGGALIIAFRPTFRSYSLPWCCRGPLAVFSGRELSPSALGSWVTPHSPNGSGAISASSRPGACLQQPSWARSDISCRIG